jgi:hypothetical protein
MTEITWRQMIIPIMVFVVAITVQLIALVPLFCSIPGYESIPYIDLISLLLNLISWLLIILLVTTAYGWYCEMEIYCSLMTHIKIDSILVIMGTGLLILGSMNIPIFSITGMVCILVAVADVCYLATSNTGPILERM